MQVHGQQWQIWQHLQGKLWHTGQHLHGQQQQIGQDASYFGAYFLSGDCLRDKFLDILVISWESYILIFNYLKKFIYWLNIFF